jgi:folate-binding protein YgfZ
VNAHYCTLSQEALLHISGPDSLKFLQGQTTCDTSQVDDGHALAGAYCNPQGRMVCDFLLCQLGNEHFAMRMRQEIVTTSAATFGKYIIFSKAELDGDNAGWQSLACWGSDIRDALGAVFPQVPEEKFGACTGGNFVLVQIDGAGRQYECYIDTSAAPDLLEQLMTTITEATESTWQALQIESGIGRIEAATVETFIPQMLNYDITGHVNFKKGCYTGQEVVARMHYRGKPKRRMYLASLPSGDIPTAGTALYADESAQSVGNVVNSALAADGQVLALVVATVDGVENGLHVGAADGPLLEMATLPYSLEKS